MNAIECYRLRSFFDKNQGASICANCDQPVSEHRDLPCLNTSRVGRCPYCGKWGADHVSPSDPVLEIVRGIYKDLTGRSGLGLDNIDDETKAEMVTKWYGIVNRHFKITTLLGSMEILREVERPRD